jgi:hypothetical protein
MTKVGRAAMSTKASVTNSLDVQRIETLIDTRFPQIHSAGRSLIVEEAGQRGVRASRASSTPYAAGRHHPCGDVHARRFRRVRGHHRGAGRGRPPGSHDQFEYQLLSPNPTRAISSRRSASSASAGDWRWARLRSCPTACPTWWPTPRPPMRWLRRSDEVADYRMSILLIFLAFERECAVDQLTPEDLLT